MRLPVFKLKLVRSGWIAFPRIDLDQPQLAAYFFHKLIGKAAVEHAAVIFLNPVQQVVGSTVIGMGDLGRVNMVAREVFKSAILANASSVMVSHNHPNGIALPSPEDIHVTQRLIRAGNILGIKVLDHIIVTPSDTDFTSMRESEELLLWWSRERVQSKAPPAPSEPGSGGENL